MDNHTLKESNMILNIRDVKHVLDNWWVEEVAQ